MNNSLRPRDLALALLVIVVWGLNFAVIKVGVAGVPPLLLGRTMGLFMFIFMGLQPVAAAASGWLLQAVTPSQLFLGSGAALVALAALAFVATPMRGMRDAQAAPAAPR